LPLIRASKRAPVKAAKATERTKRLAANGTPKLGAKETCR